MPNDDFQKHLAGLMKQYGVDNESELADIIISLHKANLNKGVGDDYADAMAKRFPLEPKKYSNEHIEEMQKRRLGLTTPTDNGWTDVKKLGKAIGNKLSDMYQTQKEINPLLQLGLISSVNANFDENGKVSGGDNSLLNMWNSKIQSEKNRYQQRQWNNDMKALEEARASAEERAEWNKDYPRAVKQYEALEATLIDPSKSETEKLDAQDELNALVAIWNKRGMPLKTSQYEERRKARIADAANKDAADKAEQVRLNEVSAFMMNIPTTFKSQTEKTEWANKNIDNNDMLTDAEKIEARNKLMSVKDTKTAIAESTQSAVAGLAGKKVGEKLQQDDDETKRYNELKNKAFRSMNDIPFIKAYERKHKITNSILGGE